MTGNPYQHVDVRVTDMDQALQFYSKLLPAVGFTHEDHGENFICFVGEGTPPARPWFGFTEDRNHIRNTNRIAFQAESREDVDRVAAIALKAGAKNMSGPRACPEYSASYYAAFFEDPCGNCLEICYLEG